MALLGLDTGLSRIHTAVIGPQAGLGQDLNVDTRVGTGASMLRTQCCATMQCRSSLLHDKTKFARPWRCDSAAHRLHHRSA